MANTSKFEIHYYLTGGAHSMNAVLRNNAEKEFLALAQELIEIFDLDLFIEAEAWETGGLKNYWVFKNPLGTVTAIMAGGTLIVQILSYIHTVTPDQDTKDNMLLENAKFCLEIKELLKNAPGENINEEVIKKCAISLNNNSKITARRSNFYKNAAHVNNLEKIGFTALDDKSTPISEEKSVLASDFVKFIMSLRKKARKVTTNGEDFGMMNLLLLV